MSIPEKLNGICICEQCENTFKWYYSIDGSTEDESAVRVNYIKEESNAHFKMDAVCPSCGATIHFSHRTDIYDDIPGIF